MAEQAEPRMTVEEFLDWSDRTDTRHMLLDGVVVATAPPTGRHSVIAGNTAFEIRRRLKPPCRVLVKAGLQLASDTCVQADLAASCEELGPRQLMKEPILLVEVLSPSTRRDDLGLKVVSYQELPTAREIWVIDSEQRWVRLWRRVGDEWIQRLPLRAGTFRSEVLEAEIALDDLYAMTGL